MKECKIVQDLFPSYIDQLTNDSTNQYVENHLDNCKQCKKVLEDMKKDLKMDISKNNNKEVKYIKKFNKRMKLLKAILIGILIIFLLSFARKMIIIVSLNNKISNYTNSKNYYIKTFNYTGDEIITIECYKKEEKYIRRLKSSFETGKITTTDYYNGKIVNTYSELKFDEDTTEYVSRKTADLNKEDKGVIPSIPNSITINNLITFLGMPLFSSITSEKCNGKDCYRIVIYSLNTNNESIYYIDKETGLTIREIGVSGVIDSDGQQYDLVTDFQYKFDVVTEEDFIEPDINEYEIQI